jgi:hypothetical protein
LLVARQRGFGALLSAHISAVTAATLSYMHGATAGGTCAEGLLVSC